MLDVIEGNPLLLNRYKLLPPWTVGEKARRDVDFEDGINRLVIEYNRDG